MSARIVFFGNERLATGVQTSAPVLQALIDAGYQVAAVVSQFEAGKSRKPRPLEIAAVAAEHNIPLLLPHKMADIADQLRSFDAQAGVLVAFGKIVPQSTIDIFPHGIINIHPSLLPKHRGPTPLESVILSGETETGVSVMQLAAKMDAGPVYAQQQVTLRGDETKQQLADQLLLRGRDLVIGHLPAILDDSLQPTPQDDSAATYDDLISKPAGVLDWQQPAALLARQVRAYADWPKSCTTIGGSDVIVTAAHAVVGAGTPGVVWLQDGQLGMHTSDGVLIIDQLIPLGKRRMTASDFVRGYQLKF